LLRQSGRSPIAPADNQHSKQKPEAKSAPRAQKSVSDECPPVP
jgi:hypothetical protein